MQSLADRFNVSRETIEKLEIYLALLRKWNPRINLVAQSTLKEAMERHFADSLQLWSLGKDVRTWTDLGSGGGFPGLVVAIAATETGAKVHLIESDARKCAFLRAVSRETGVPVQVHTTRIEDARPEPSDVVSARALAPLEVLLGFTEPRLKPRGFALYLKGQTCDEEIEVASRTWRFSFEKIPSVTDRRAVVLKTWDIERV